MFVLLWASINLETTCSHMRREGLCWYICQMSEKQLPFHTLYSLFLFLSDKVVCLMEACVPVVRFAGMVSAAIFYSFSFWPLYNMSHYWKKSKIMIRLAVLPQSPWNSCVIMAQCNSISAILQSFIFYLAFMHQSCRTFVFLCVYNYLSLVSL